MLTSKNKEIALSILIKFGVGVYLAILTPFQGDPHHDGYILGSAAAVADGLPVHSGAFSQYGPVTPWIAGSFLKLTSISVLNLRVLSAILTFLIYLSLERTLKKLDFSKSTARLVSISWILINHVTSTAFSGAFFLWPSLVSTLLLLLSLNLVLESIEKKYCRSLLFLSGTLIAFAFFTRIQSILVVIILISLSLLLRQQFKNVLVISLGVSVGIILVPIYLKNLGAFPDYWDQVIRWPATAYPSLGSGNNYNRFQFFLYLTLPIACLIYFWLAEKFLLNKRGLKFLVSLLFLGVIIFVISKLSGELLNSDENTYMRLIVGDQLNRIIFWPIYLCFLGTFALALLTSIPKFRRVEFDNSKSIYITSFGLSVTPQIFPQADIAHLWWIAPLLIPPALLLARSFQIDLVAFEKPFYPILIAALISSTFYLQKDWARYEYKPLVGTYAYKTKVESVKVYEPLTQYLLKENALFLCHDGLHAIASQRYAAIDQWFVDWGPINQTKFGSIDLTSEDPRLKSARNIVVCDKDKVAVEEISITYKVKIIYFDEVKNGDAYRSLAILTKVK